MEPEKQNPLDVQTTKEVWMKPEISIISVKEETLGGGMTAADGDLDNS